MTHTDTVALSDLCPNVADDWSPTDEDWDWYLSTMADDYAENVMF